MLWLRPSTVLLAIIVAANLYLPLMQLWKDEVQAPPARRGGGATDVPPASPAAPPLRLLKAPPVAKRLMPVPAAQTPCRAWGPFDDPDEAASVAARLGLAEGAHRIHQREVRVDAGYLVTLQIDDPPAPVSALIDALSGQGVETHLLDRPGTVLAAGVFSNPQRARAQQHRLAELGYPAVVEPLLRARTEYHVLARLPADQEPEIPPAATCGDIAPTERVL